MRILVLSSTCSKGKYEEIYAKRYRPMLDSNQKFFLSLINGLKSIDNVQVDCISSLPISHNCYPERKIKTTKEVVDDVSYQYCGCFNYPYIRTITVASKMKRLVRQYLKKYKDVVVICDTLISEASSLVKLLKKKKVPSVALVTDIPSIVNEMFGKRKGIKAKLENYYGKRALKHLQMFDKYILLTEQMNELCNPNNKPYMIMECIVTPTELFENDKKSLSKLPVVLYAGKLFSDCGVLTLAKSAGFLKDKCEIWLYGGHSDCQEELESLTKRYENLKIHGILPLEEVLKVEQKATILINPRPGKKEFTKYSFPSKTAEYMMMGVPVIMHRLPGVPNEYDEFVSYIEDDTASSVAMAISKLLDKSSEERYELGMQARAFIINEKNELKQAQRVFNFINN